ncbi:MAG: hypothetical protein QGF59_20635, partial [Pirellulaceae bacterium]|nr:hypothetical protein [Pirellulaceae bacterium]
NRVSTPMPACQRTGLFMKGFAVYFESDSTDVQSESVRGVHRPIDPSKNRIPYRVLLISLTMLPLTE